MNKYISLAIASVVFVMSTGAFAQQQTGGKIQIQGDTTLKVDVETVTTTAVGSGNIAETNIGAIGGDSVQIEGDTKIEVKAKTVTTTAVGSKNCAKTNIGTIGAKSCN
ncbi:MAG: hypothetical protein JKY92_04390 [Magnetovibrio sp.]|nr:hypothetical protein [Magnetovibrio sp.]